MAYSETSECSESSENSVKSDLSDRSDLSDLSDFAVALSGSVRIFLSGVNVCLIARCGVFSGILLNFHEKKVAKIFGGKGKSAYLCTRFREASELPRTEGRPGTKPADAATQLTRGGNRH